MTTATFSTLIIGAGIVGSSIAYHLAQLGEEGVGLIDRGDPVENLGSTSHAPGGVVVLSHSKLLTQMGVYSSRLYASLPDWSPHRIMVNAVGTLEIAISEERMRDLIRLHGEGSSFGTRSRLVDPEEAMEILPYLDPSAFVGGLFVEEGEIVSGAHVSGALQRDSKVTVLGNQEVTRVMVDGDRIKGVVTAAGETINAERVVVATNIWAPLLGDELGFPVPLLGFEHQYLVSGPLHDLKQFDPSVPEDEIIYPSVRELDTYLYFRQHWNSFGIGSYRHRPRPVRADQLGASAIHRFTPDDFEGEPWEMSQKLFPFFRGSDFREYPRQINGIFAFPVDGMPIAGPTPVEGLWVAAGSWLSHAGGLGKTLAEWMTTGDTEWDVRSIDVNRFHSFQTNRRFIEKVCNKNYAEIYDIIHPREPISEPRNVRLSPFHDRHLANQAVFTTFAGLELPNWFESNANLVDERLPNRTGWEGQHWSRIQGAEHLATREKVGLFDLTGLSIIEVSGARSLDAVQWLCSSDLDVGPGRVVYTTWLTPTAGVRRDLAVTRLEPDRFWMFVGEGTRPRDLDWVRRHTEQFSGATVTDVSDSYTALGLWGPNARQVLERVSGSDLDFGYFRSRFIDLGYTRALALRLSYAGEYGWELHFPPEAALPVWDALWEAGENAGLTAAGFGAFDSLRLEKGYRGWGTDVHTEYNPFEAGLGRMVNLEKPDFIGAEAARRLAQAPVERMLTCLTVDGPLMGAEPIMARDTCVGYVTSSNYGYSVETDIAYGYLPSALSQEGTELEIIYFGDQRKARVAADPLFDPKMTRMRA